MQKQKIQVSIPANLRYSALVRHIADEVFGIAKFSKAWCSRLKLVVDELFMNATSYGSTEDKSLIYITFLYDQNEVQFIIEDDGTGSQAIKADELKNITQRNEKNTDLARTSGRGLSMIAKLWTDQLKITQSQHGGIAISFTKHIETSAAPPPPSPPPSELIQSAQSAISRNRDPGKRWPSAGSAIPQTGKVKADAAPEAALTLKSESLVYEVKLSGEIDSSNISAKVASIYDQIEVMPEGCVLVLDCSDLDYINSTFIGNLVAWHTILKRKGGQIRLKHVNDEIREVLNLVGLLKVLEVES